VGTIARPCSVCLVLATGTRLPVLIPGRRYTEWHLCGRCWSLLNLGVPLHDRNDRLEYFSTSNRLLLSAEQVRTCIGLAISQVFPTAAGSDLDDTLRRLYGRECEPIEPDTTPEPSPQRRPPA
jgi:hypothetical protein